MRALLLALILSAPAAAAVVSSGPDGFTLRHEGVSALPPEAAWEALEDWGGWWPDAHSYSGKAENFDLDAEADGELEEEWDGGSVLHAEVVLAMPPKLLRLHGGFGPLQAIPVQAVLDFALAPEGTGTKLVLTYKVGGPASLDLAKLAGPVDQVLGEAFARLLAHTPPEPEPAEKPKRKGK
jgi:uncharacterized protein YndB with AHSA1/START domain